MGLCGFFLGVCTIGEGIKFGDVFILGFYLFFVLFRLFGRSSF